MSVPGFMDDPLTWCKDVITPGMSVLATIGIALFSWQHRRQEARETAVRQDERDRVIAERAAEVGVTSRLQMLLDSYEARIKDLTSEVSGLRAEVGGLRADLAYHRRHCATCPHFKSHLEDDNGPSAAVS